MLPPCRSVLPPPLGHPLLTSLHIHVSLTRSPSSAEMSSPSHSTPPLARTQTCRCSASLPAISRGNCSLRREAGVLTCSPATIVPQDKPPLTWCLPFSPVALVPGSQPSSHPALSLALIILSARGSFPLVPLPWGSSTSSLPVTFSLSTSLSEPHSGLWQPLVLFCL